MGTSPRRTVLVVDDEELFLRTVTDGFAAHADRLNVITAPNGKVAVAALERGPVDLVVTDLKMPELDGFGLLAHMSRHHRGIPVVVMTAFGTPEIEARLQKLGVLQYLDKPLEFRQLAERVFEILDANARGQIQGITLPSFLQMISMELKSCCLSITAGGRLGSLFFVRGELLHARTGAIAGDEAAMEIVGWDEAQIAIEAAAPPRGRTVTMGLGEVLLEAFRRKDEDARGGGAVGIHAGDADYFEVPLATTGTTTTDDTTPSPDARHQEENMAAQDKLKELTALEGFGGVAVFTPTGESLALLPGDVSNLKEVGVLANAVLLNAQKASLEMGTGRGQQVHVECERAHILARCLNEGTDPTRSQPGKAHIHMIVALKSDATIGLAKMRINSVIEKLAEDFRL